MHLGTQAVLNGNESKFNSFTTYSDTKVNFDANITEEQSLANSQELRKRTSTSAKKLVRFKAGDYIVDLSRKICLYAVIAEDETLLHQIRFNDTEIKRSSDNKLVLIFDTVFGYATKNQANLLECGVTPLLLAEGSQLLDNLKAEMQNALLSKHEQKQFTAQLKQQLKITDTAFVTIDAMVESMRKADPVFYRLYSNARRKLKSGRTSLSVRGKVIDAITGLPLRKAKITFISVAGGNENASFPVLLNAPKFTGAKGGFQFKSLPTGTYLFLVTYSGYVDQQVTIYVNEGVLSRIEIRLTQLEQATGI